MILALYGAGAMGREFRQIARESGEWNEIVFIDDHKADPEMQGCPIYRFRELCRKFSPEEVRFVVAMGEPAFRAEAFEKLKNAGYVGGLLIHPSACISADALIGEGTAVCHGAFVGSQARIGKNCYISRNATVGHDAVVGDHTRLGVNAFVGGHTVIGTNAFIGAGAMLRDRIHIGSGSVAAMGAAVFEDVPDNATVIGNPARIVSEGDRSLVYAPSREIKSLNDEKSIEERYREVFDRCFEGLDFDPAVFKYRDEGWDSAAHMTLIGLLEDEFSISVEGREIMRLRSYTDGLELIKRKLEHTDGGQCT